MAALKIGTRGSPLALRQAEETRARLLAADPGLGVDDVEIVVITTTGDRIRDRPLADIGGKGLFTKEIEQALFDGAVDMAVHSMKDMPAELPDGLVIACLFEREDPRDAFLSPVAGDIADLPQGARVGSSSVRRAAQLKRLRADIEVVDFRGNVETRLRKLADGQVAATFLACAGLNRLGMGDVITRAIAVDDMLPAVAQGAIGVEILAKRDDIAARLAPLNHADTVTTIAAERAFLAGLDGSCRTPLAGHARLEGGELRLDALALTRDGSKEWRTSRRGAVSDAGAMGADAAAEIRARAGERLFA